MFKNIFSKRNQPEPDVLKYDIPELARNRIIQVFKHFEERGAGSIGMMLEEVFKECQLRYGGLCQAEEPNRAFRASRDPVLAAADHFLLCPPDYCIDFLEMCFHSNYYGAGQHGVDMINAIFRDEGIGYEFSPHIVKEIDLGPTPGAYGDGSRGVRYEITPSIATKKTDSLVHSTVVLPALHVLAKPHFKTANAELLKAHEHYRKGEYPAAIVSAGQAYESVFKVICDRKKWPYQQKDTLSRLVEICRDQKLFEPHYTEPLKAPGTIRNSSAHGKGTQAVTVKPEQAEHMIHAVSANILLLTRLAKL